MSKVFTRGRSGKWQCEVYVWDEQRGCRRRILKSTGITVDGTAASRRTAEEVARKIERDLATRGADAARPVRTIEQALVAIIAASELAGRTEDTRENITSRGVRIAEHFGPDKSLREIDAAALVAYAQQARKTRTAATVLFELEVIGRCFRAFELPVPRMPNLGRVASKPQRVLELDELRALMLAVAPHRKLNILAYAQLGLRLSEPWKITEVDWSGRYVHVAGTKTSGSDRDVPIPDELYEAMLARRDEWPVFPAWDMSAVDAFLRRASRRALGEAISVNDLRGTYATHMARAGVPILTLAKIMGNSVKMLESTYAQVGRRGDHLRDAADKLPRLAPSRASEAKVHQTRLLATAQGDDSDAT